MWKILMVALGESVCQTQMYLTPCNEFHKRSALVYRSEECEQVSIKSNFFDCNLECGPGKFLEFYDDGLVRCSDCPSGSYSLGGGVVYGSENSPWSGLLNSEIYNDCWILKNNTEFHNYLCQAWQPYQSILQSSQAPLNTSYTSRLIFSLNIVKPGFFHMRYKKDSFLHNGLNIGSLSIFINSNMIYQDSSIYQTNWNIFNHPLNLGLIEIIIEYSVMPTNQHPDPKAYISTIEIQGNQYIDLGCTKCNKNTLNSQCQICIENQYFDNGTCHNCPNDKYSLKGTIGEYNCIVRKKCEETDLKKIFSNCVNGQRNISFEWIQPKICLDSGEIDADDLLNVKCDDCTEEFLEYSQGNYSKCEDCGKSLYFNYNLGQCSMCEPGFFVYSLLNVSGFWGLFEGFNSFCLNDAGSICSPDVGWFAVRGYLTTGDFFQPNVTKYLYRDVNVVQSKGMVKVKYYVKSESSQIFVYVDGELDQMWNNSGDGLGVVNLNKGFHRIQWVFKTNSSKQEEAKIFYIEIWGSEEGIGKTCEKCEKGSILPNQSNSCTPCEEGYEPNPEQTSCIKCQNTSISSAPGEICSICPENTKPNKQNTACLANKFINSISYTYYLEYLSGVGQYEGIYNKGVCNLTSANLFCHQTFYGPLITEDKIFYLSILNPSILALPEASHLYEPRLGYAFELIDQQKLSHKKVSTYKTCLNNKFMVNLGSKVDSILINSTGFTVIYSMGDTCQHPGMLYNTRVDVYCNKSAGAGWPIFVAKSGCTYIFSWVSKYGCPVCKYKELVSIAGECKDGKRVNKKIPNEGCIVPTDTNIQWTESCSELNDVIFSWPFFVIVGFFVILVVVGITSLVFYNRYKTEYKLLTHNTERSE